MITDISIKQLDALTEIPESLVTPYTHEKIFFTKLNKDTVCHPEINEYLSQLTIRTMENWNDIAYVMGRICAPVNDKDSYTNRWLVISTEAQTTAYPLSITETLATWGRQEYADADLKTIPHRVFLIERIDRGDEGYHYRYKYNFYLVSDTPTPSKDYSDENKVLFFKSCFRCLPKYYKSVIENADFETLGIMCKTLSSVLKVAKAKFADLVQQEDQP